MLHRWTVGPSMEGLGSTHTPHGYVWPLAMMVQGLTSGSAGDRVTLLRRLLQLQASFRPLTASIAALCAPNPPADPLPTAGHAAAAPAAAAGGGRCASALRPRPHMHLEQPLAMCNIHMAYCLIGSSDVDVSWTEQARCWSHTAARAPISGPAFSLPAAPQVNAYGDLTCSAATA